MISVVMAAYKEPAEIFKQAVDSILNQSYRDLELIVVLDNPDNQELKKVLQEKSEEDSRLVFLINEQNLGLTNSLNKAIGKARGSFIARMDADDISLPGRLEKQISWMEEKGIDLSGTQTEVIDESGRVLFQSSAVPSKHESIRNCLKYGQVIAHPSWMVRREVYQKLNGYRDIPLAEDYDLTLRAVRNGFRVGNVPEVLLQYRMSASSISRTNLFDQYLTMKELSAFYKKGIVPEPDEVKEAVQNKRSEKKAKAYVRANFLFNRTLSSLTEKNYGSFLLNGFQLAFSSASYLDKIRRFVMISLKADRTGS